METGSRQVSAFAPASVSNVACGFDVLGFAIEGEGDVVSARVVEGPAKVVVAELSGQAAGIPLEAERNTAAVAAAALLREMAPEGTPRRLELRIDKGIAPAGGLGSSAASAVAAVVATDALLGLGAGRETLLHCAIEGEAVASGGRHGDNVAPALLGGFQLVRLAARPATTALPVPEELAAVILRPRLEVETGASRRLLGDRIPLAAAVQQWGNTAALAAGLCRGDLELVASALHDAVAEPLRAATVPRFREVQEAALAAGALGCSLSGSGPSLFALCRRRDGEAVLAAMRRAFEPAGVDATGWITAVGVPGARVLETPCAT